jgi:hypothetical protein
MKIDFEQKEKIDWDKQQLLICERTNQIVLTTGKHECGLFHGTEIGGKKEFHDDWIKELFIIFKGKISND